MGYRYWRGTANNSWIGNNWVEETGTSAAYPVTGDEVVFDEALGSTCSAPTTQMDQNTITLERFAVSKDWDNIIGDSGNPLIIGVKDTLIDGEQSGDIYFYSLEEPTATIRRDGTGDYLTFTSAEATCTAGSVVYVYQDSRDATGTVFEEKIQINQSITFRGIGSVAISGTTAAAGLSAVLMTGGIIEWNNIDVVDTFSTTDGGGISITGAGTSATIKRCTISNCSTTCSGGGIEIDNSAACVVEDCIIEDCYCNAYGAGVRITTNPTVLFERVKVLSNHAGLGGGGMAITNVDATCSFVNCLLHDNYGYWTGGVRFVSSSTGANKISFVNCTLTNDYNVGAAGHCKEVKVATGSSPEFINCIIGERAHTWTTTAEKTCYCGSSDEHPTFDFCNMEGASGGIAIGVGTLFLGSYTNNINADPQFLTEDVDSVNPFDIGVYSPCIDIGTTADAPSDDITWGARTVAPNSIDLGCYEYGATDSPAGKFEGKHGRIWLRNLASASTIYFRDEVDSIYFMRGESDIDGLSGYNQDFIVSYLTGKTGDVEITIDGGVVLPAEVRVYGGKVDCAAQVGDILIRDGLWNQDVYGIDSLVMYGGAFNWLDGDITSALIHNAVFDGTNAFTQRTLTDLEMFTGAMVDINDGVGGITITNPVQLWGGRLITADNQTFTVT